MLYARSQGARQQNQSDPQSSRQHRAVTNSPAVLEKTREQRHKQVRSTIKQTTPCSHQLTDYTQGTTRTETQTSQNHNEAKGPRGGPQLTFCTRGARRGRRKHKQVRATSKQTAPERTRLTICARGARRGRKKHKKVKAIIKQTTPGSPQLTSCTRGETRTKTQTSQIHNSTHHTRQSPTRSQQLAVLNSLSALEERRGRRHKQVRTTTKRTEASTTHVLHSRREGGGENTLKSERQASVRTRNNSTHNLYSRSATRAEETQRSQSHNQAKGPRGGPQLTFCTRGAKSAEKTQTSQSHNQAKGPRGGAQLTFCTRGAKRSKKTQTSQSHKQADGTRQYSTHCLYSRSATRAEETQTSQSRNQTKGPRGGPQSSKRTVAVPNSRSAHQEPRA